MNFPPQYTAPPDQDPFNIFSAPKAHSPAPQPQSQPQNNTADLEQVLGQFAQFMQKLDTKLNSLDQQIQQLSREYNHVASQQDKNAQQLANRLAEVKAQMAETRSVAESFPGVEPHYQPVQAPSLSAPVVTQDKFVQESNDAALARKLQEEFDKALSLSQPANHQPPPANPVSNYPLPTYQPLSPPPANAVANYQVPSYQPLSPPVNPSASTNMYPNPDPTSPCPMCGIPFPANELQDHVAAHFADESNQADKGPQNAQNAQNKPSGGFFNKIFGNPNPPPQPRPVMGAPPPTQSVYYSQNPQMVHRPVYIGPDGQILNMPPQQ